MVKDRGQLPPAPSGLGDDEQVAVANRLHSAALRLLRHARVADADMMDLDGPRASALSVLVFGGSMPIGRLAEAEQVSAPAITKTVAALEAEGLVRRVRSETDRRVVDVVATAAGRAVLERGRTARVRRVAGLLDGLAPEDLRLLERAADLIADRLGRV
jgi:DNA-binding MarR family transcriptional regulator